MAFMHIHHPKIAARWDKEYKKKKNLPQHVKKKGTRVTKNPGIEVPYRCNPRWI